MHTGVESRVEGDSESHKSPTTGSEGRVERGNMNCLHMYGEGAIRKWPSGNHAATEVSSEKGQRSQHRPTLFPICTSLSSVHIFLHSILGSIDLTVRRHEVTRSLINGHAAGRDRICETSKQARSSRTLDTLPSTVRQQLSRVPSNISVLAPAIRPGRILDSSLHDHLGDNRSSPR